MPRLYIQHTPFNLDLAGHGDASPGTVSRRLMKCGPSNDQLAHAAGFRLGK